MAWGRHNLLLFSIVVFALGAFTAPLFVSAQNPGPYALLEELTNADAIFYLLMTLLSGFLGHCIVEFLFESRQDYIREQLRKYPEKDKDNEGKDEEYVQHYTKLSDWIGVIERILYTGSILLGFPYFVAIWLPLKMVGGWGEWSKPGQLARARFIVSLIGNGLSLLVAAAFAILAQYGAIHWL